MPICSTSAYGYPSATLADSIPGRPITSFASCMKLRMGSSPVNCLTMFITIGGISSAWAGRTSPLMVRTMISAHSSALRLASR